MPGLPSDKRHRPGHKCCRGQVHVAETAARDAPLYSQRFGAGTGELVHWFTRSVNDAHLPDVHNVMASYKERSP
jgi:hypothetical protein